MSDHEPIEVVIRRIPIVGLPGLECIVRVDELGEALDGNGDPVGGERKCGADGVWMIGAAPTCAKHWPMVCEVAGLDEAGIEAEWRANL